MVDIYLVRHGEAAAKWGEDPDPGLSPLGRQQAQAVRDQLEVGASLKLISSPLLRAQETALPLANVLRESVTIVDTYREIPSPVGIDDRQAWLKGFMKQNWEEQGPDILQWRDNIWSSLFEIDGDCVIFTHFMVINAVVSRLTTAEPTVCCVPANGSVTRLRLEGHALKLVELGHQHQTLVN
jgi:broad specificity phosphatase PhoE